VSAPSSQSQNGAASDRPLHLLVVAGETLAAPQVLERIRELVGDREASAFVVAPALTSSGVNLAAGDIDGDIERARRRLQESEEALRELGIESQGEVGDSDPSMALEDALRRFEADQVVIAVREGDRARFLESDALDKTPGDLGGRPVTQIVVDPAGEGGSSQAEVRQPRSGEGQARDVQPGGDTYHLPPMPGRYWLGIAFGVIGTALLFFFALTCQNDHEGRQLPVECAITQGLAIAALIVNVFHVVGLLLFGSAGYRGRWAALAADTVLYGMPVAVIAGLVLTIIA
jgi:hypothetical protein